MTVLNSDYNPSTDDMYIQQQRDVDTVAESRLPATGPMMLRQAFYSTPANGLARQCVLRRRCPGTVQRQTYASRSVGGARIIVVTAGVT